MSIPHRVQSRDCKRGQLYVDASFLRGGSLTTLALALAATLHVGGCAVADGLRLTGEYCDTEDDCWEYHSFCTPEGCVDYGRNASGYSGVKSCSNKPDCNTDGNSGTGITCPTWAANCECLDRACVVDTGNLCTSNDGCPGGTICATAYGRCILPFACGTTSDCGLLRDLCTTDGCVDGDDFSAETCGSACTDKGGTCLDGRACGIDRATSCSAREDCAPGELCRMESRSCVAFVERDY